jgi:hypothetical protein
MNEAPTKAIPGGEFLRAPIRWLLRFSTVLPLPVVQIAELALQPTLLSTPADAALYSISSAPRPKST